MHVYMCTFLRKVQHEMYFLYTCMLCKLVNLYSSSSSVVFFTKVVVLLVPAVLLHQVVVLKEASLMGELCPVVS